MAYLLVAFLILSLCACSKNLTDKNDITRLFQKNEQSFLTAAETGDWEQLEKIRGINDVFVLDAYIDIQCGGAGFGPSTHYYGIFYSADDNLCAIDVAGPKDQLIAHEGGYLYQEENGDNRYYVEALGNHFYYYEAHF